MTYPAGKYNTNPEVEINNVVSTLKIGCSTSRPNFNLKTTLVGCGLTSHSAIFHLYSDGTVAQFPNFDLLPGTQCHGQLRVFSVPSLPRHGYRDVRRRLFPPSHQRAHILWRYAGNRNRILRSTVQPATSTTPRRDKTTLKQRYVPARYTRSYS